MHTITQRLVLTKQGDTCTVEVTPSVTLYEFE